MRRLAGKLAPVLIPLALILVAAARAFTSPDWLDARIRQILTVELAQRLGQDIRIGEVSGHLLGDVVVSGFSIARRGGPEPRAWARADEIRLGYRGWDMLRGRVSPVAGVRKLVLVRPRLSIVRGADGHVSALDVLPKRRPGAPPPEPLPVPVQFEDAALEYTDLALPTRNGKPFRVRLVQADGTIVLGHKGRLTIRIEGRNPDGLFGSGTAVFEYGSEPRFFSVRALVGGAHGGPFANWFLRSPHVKHRASLAEQLRGTVSGFREGDEWAYDYNIVGDVRATVALTALGGQNVDADGRVRLTTHALSGERVRVRTPGLVAAVTGTVLGLGDSPMLDLEVEAQSLDLNRSAVLFADAVPAALKDARADRPAAGRVAVVGSWPHLSVTGTVSMARFGGGAPVDAVADWHAEEAQANFTVLDLAEPSVEAVVSARRVEAEVARGGLVLDAGVVSAGGVSARLTWSAEGGVELEGRVDALSSSTVSGVELRGEGHLVGEAAEFTVGGTALAGTMELAGSAEWSGADGPRVAFAGQATRVSVPAIRQLPWADEGVLERLALLEGVPQGEASLRFSGEAGPDAVRLGGTGAVEGLVLRRVREAPGDGVDGGPTALEYRLPRLATVAQAQWRGEVAAGEGARKWELDSARGFLHGADERGSIWAEASYPAPVEGGDQPRAGFEGAFGAVDVDLGAIGAMNQVEGLSGRLAAEGAFQIAPRTADAGYELAGLRARLAAVMPRYDEYGLDALTATLSGDLEEVAVEEGVAYAGESEAAIGGSVREIRLAEADAVLDLIVSTGQARLADWLSAANVSVDVQGTVVAATAAVTGHWDNPRVALDGPEIVRATVAGYRVDHLKAGQVRFADYDLRVRGVEARAAGAVWHVPEAAFENLLGDRDITAQVEVQNLWLASLPWQLPPQVRLSGGLDGFAEISGTLDAPEASGRVAASQLYLNGRALSDLRTAVEYHDGLLRLASLEIRGLGGTLEGTGDYALDRGEARTDIVLTGVRLDRALRLAAEVAGDGTTRIAGLDRAADVLRGSLHGRLHLGAEVAMRPDGSYSLAGLAASTEARLTGATLQTKRIPDIEARADFTDDRLLGLSVTAAQRGMTMTASAEADFDGELSAEIDARDVELGFIRAWLPVPREIRGRLSALAELTGPLARPNLAISDGRVVVEELGRVRTQPITFAANIPLQIDPPYYRVRDAVEATAELRDADIALFTDLADALLAATPAQEGAQARPKLASRIRATGTVDGRMALRGPAGSPGLEGDLRLARGTLGPAGGDPLLTDVGLSLSLRAGQERGPGEPLATSVELRGFQASLDTTTLTAGGTATIPQLSAEGVRQSGVDLSIRAAAERQSLAPGPELRQANLIVKATREIGEDEPLRVSIVDEGRAEMGSGSATLTGWAAVREWGLRDILRNDMDFRLVLDDARVRYAPYFTGVVRTAPSLRISNPAPGEAVRVRGRLIASDAEVGFGKRRPGPIPPRPAQWLGASPNWPSPSFVVVVDLGRRVAVRAPGLRLPLRPLERTVVLTGTPQAPTLVTHVEGRRGGLETAAGRVTVHYAELDHLLGPTGEQRAGRAVLAELADSEVAARGTMTVGEYEIEIRVSGRPGEPVITLTSSPQLSEEEIVRLLFGGAPSDLPSDAPLRERFLAQLSATAFPRLESRILSPLAEAIIGTGAVDTLTVRGVLAGAPTIEVGKFLLKDVYATFRHTFTAQSRPGTPDEFEFKLSYRVRDRYQVSFSTNEQGDDRLSVEYRVRF